MSHVASSCQLVNVFGTYIASEMGANLAIHYMAAGALSGRMMRHTQEAKDREMDLQ